jgi:two-component system, NtrC family, sensor histidine kinase HydH
LSKDLNLHGLIHDLNNVFQTFVDLADELSEDPRREPLAQAILRNVERGVRISRSMERSANPGAPFEEILGDAITFVEDARLALPGTEIRFHKSVDREIVLRRNWAWERVLINLFLNAVRAMPEGGTIEVEARRRGGEIHIAVRDTGLGIAPDLLPRLFEPMVSTKQNGGIGLHVVKMVVDQDGGSVTARNRGDSPGAEFLFRLPETAGEREPAEIYKSAIDERG